MTRRKTKGDDDSAYLDPMHSVGYQCRVNFRDFSRVLEQLTLPYGISAGPWRFLRVLWEEDGLSQRQLSERAGLREATTVRAVRSMMEAGLVVRTQCPDDKRKFIVKLTPKGRKLRTRLMPMVVKVNEIALRGIPKKDVDVARRVLAQSYANLRETIESGEY